jgi:hypothetical protein
MSYALFMFLYILLVGKLIGSILTLSLELAPIRRPLPRFLFTLLSPLLGFWIHCLIKGRPDPGDVLLFLLILAVAWHTVRMERPGRPVLYGFRRNRSEAVRKARSRKE